MSSEEDKVSFTLESPFSKTIQTFDKESAFPDFDLAVPGFDHPLHLHRATLAQASLAFVHLFKGEGAPCCTVDEEKRNGQWTDERAAEDNRYREILLKMLRFCYGEDQTFSSDDCTLALEVVSQLQLEGGNEIREKIERVPKEIAQSKVNRASLVRSFLDRHPEIENGEEVKAIPKKYNYSEREMLTSFLAANEITVKELTFSREDRSSREAFVEDGNPNRYDYSLMIAKFMKTNNTITKLAVIGFDEMANGTVAICEALAENTTLADFSISYVNDSSGQQALSSFVKVSPSLTKLDMDYCKLERNGVAIMCDGLRSSTSLTDLNLSSCSVSNGMDSLCEVLKISTPLAKLNLSHNHLESAELALISEALKTNTTLTWLDLSHNDIENGDKGYRALADGLSVNSTLKRLSLAVNYCREAGAPIGQALRNNKGLTFLDISENYFGDPTVMKIVQGLRSNSTLRSLSLMKDEVGHESMRAFCDYLKNTTTLSELDLSRNEIGRTRTGMLSSALRVNKSLKKLILYGNHIANGEARVLSDALRVNKSLTCVELRGNRTGAEGVNALKAVQRTNPTLTELYTEIGQNPDECMIM